MAITALVVQTSTGTYAIVPSAITRYYVPRTNTKPENLLVIETLGKEIIIPCPSGQAALDKHAALLTGLTAGSGTLTLDDQPTPTTTLAPTTQPAA